MYSKLFSLTLALLCLSVFVQAQEKVDSVKVTAPREFMQEIKVGVGYYTYPLLAEQSFAKQKERDLFTAMKPKSSAVYSFGFFGFINEEWNIGINLSLENLLGSIEKNVFDTITQRDTIAKSDYRVRAISIFPSAHKYWKQSKMLNLYSGIGLGISLRSYDISGNLNIGKSEDTQIGFSFQATALGVRFGNKYAGFAELGFGNLGVVHVGFSAGF